eukprot:TRINITY_DN4859_c0_g1_i2.p1 TRINITY_DN4859_c0_g1~~TRINITY_DN4859_c0_g1_i2.p1  ORF type:complete len:459 (-),score=94.53 TRINITY_DN4859_c0_g1_i2:130-1506(-)
MDRVIPYPRKICEKRWEQRRHEMHRERLQNIKPTIDTREPKAVRMEHVFNNLKKEQMLEERYSEIDRENRILLKKMSDIMRSPRDLTPRVTPRVTPRETPRGPAASGGAGGPHSLNRDARKKELLRITRENQHILRRIQQAQPVYNHVEWDADHRKNSAYLKNVAEYPLILRQPRKNPLTSQLVPIGEDQEALQDEAGGASGSVAKVCACGNVFAEGSVFCRKCGAKRQEQLESAPRIVFQENRLISGSNYQVEMATDGRVLNISARHLDSQAKFGLLVRERAHKKLMHEVNGDYSLLAQRLGIANGRLTLIMDASLPAPAPSSARKRPPDGTSGFVPPAPGRANGRGQLPEGADNRLLDADAMVAAPASAGAGSVARGPTASAGTVGRATTAEFDRPTAQSAEDIEVAGIPTGTVNAEFDLSSTTGDFQFRVRGLTPGSEDNDGIVPNTPSSAWLAR